MSNDQNLVQVIAVAIFIGIGILIFARGFLFRAFGSLVAWLLSRQAGRIVIAMVLLAGGVFYLVNTQSPSAYQHLSQEKLSQLQALPGRDGVYLYDFNDPFIAYIVDPTDFQGYTPFSAFQFSGNLTSVIYDANNVRDVYLGNDDVSVIKGYHVLQFTLGNDTYTSSTYQANPNGPLQGAWLLGLGLVLAGVLLLCFTLALPFWRQQQAKAAVMAPPDSPFSYPPYQMPGTPQPGFLPTTSAQNPSGQAFRAPQAEMPPGPPRP